ncbi:phosphoglucosamine mutase [Stygiolobus caldivivus]|uniref:Phosphoglucosamine mutase n=1 Tax=Stygiolobus caldivivus TaxID=2824673 RepID=A0A8D5ZFQ8_9CREN|nr:phosphoglucosamine mutase [Stygiolobus caldivivus]BCU70408.1 phosphoglucosamine mutase [Stygiolobus caldivivus]
MGKLFGTDGVRGITNKELTPEMALKLAKAIGTYFSKGSKVLIGRDARAGGDMLMRVVEAGLLSVGVQVYDGGMAATPALQYAVKTLGYDAGVIVTASHNPAPYNGIKVIDHDGIEIRREKEDEIEQIYFTEKFNTQEWSSLTNEVKKEDRVIDIYVKGVLSHVDTEKVAKKHYTVLIDSANSVGGLSTPLVARGLGCKIFTLNGNIDPLFPARQPEPTFDSLKETANVAKTLKVDLTVTHDGDADRAIFIDSEGRVQWGDRSATLLSYWAHVKNPNASNKVVTAVSSSSLVEEYLSKFGLEVIWMKVGSVDIAHRVQDEKALAGFEENGGFMYPPHQYVRDGAMSFALMLELMAEENATSAELFDKLPKYYLVKTKVELKPGYDVNKLYSKLISMYEGKGKMLTIDGVKVVTSDYWFLVRKSGTEPIIRILVEAKDEEKANNLAQELKSIVESG